MNFIDIDKLNLSFQSNTFFNDLSVQFAAEQFHCILGSSGVGKSSLLKILAGLLPADSGDISIQPADIAWMPQAASLLPWLNVLDNVLIGSKLRGESRQPNEQARQLLRQVGLSGAEKLKPAQLSGGMAQRVSLVRTLLQDKPIILMDEPFSAVDAVTRYQLQQLSKSLLKDQTVLMVTHDPLEAIRLADQVWVMSGRPAQFVEQISLPSSHEVRELDSALWHQHQRVLDLLASKEEKADA